jgi:CheY-like chemotaxis protein
MGEGVVILFIEDDAGQRVAIARALRRAGYAVLEAADVDAAINILREERDISLILADLVVPGSERRGVIEQLRREAGGIPKLVISGYPPHRCTAAVQDPGCGGVPAEAVRPCRAAGEGSGINPRAALQRPSGDP